MFPLGNHLTLEFYRVPWLLWLHLFLTFLLLLLLLSYFGIFAFDFTAENGSPSTVPADHFTSMKSSHMENSSSGNSNSITESCLQRSKVSAYGATIKGEPTTTITRSIRSRRAKKVEEEEIKEMEDSSTKEVEHVTSQYSYSLCFYLRLVREAFLKCLGLNSTDHEDDSSITTEPEKKAHEGVRCKIGKPTSSSKPPPPKQKTGDSAKINTNPSLYEKRG